MKKYAVIVAAGSGLRMGYSVPKQFLSLRGKPVLWYTITTFLNAFEDLEIILVLPNDFMETGKSIIQATASQHRIKLVPGGETRFHSVKNGLRLIQDDSIIFVHDGVRCLVSEDLIKRCYDGAIEKGNAVPAITVIDSVRIETANGNEIIDRDKVKIIQTPQTFKSEILQQAFNREYEKFFTDEASVVENAGIRINLIEGEETNIKITRPMDMTIAESYLRDR
ncbi:MAG: 2-C-methyl-D-erythritol 4-phosphate cytidylyltransferase [Bacteroidetes bacterium]|nr:2-C-methyl-D-erythritol 4-phosphate cytidylyltransferase [Bacteroidota bacterium]